MDKYEIRNQILGLVEKYTSDKVNSAFDSNELKSFHLVSANLLKYMPDINPDNHKEIYEKLLKFKALENIPQFFKTFDLDNFFMNLPSEKFLKKSPAIYISYHMGAYRTAILPMVKNNINLVIVIDTSIYSLDELEKPLMTHFGLAKELFPTSTTDLKILSANDKNTVIELMDKIYKGYSILTYIDWNSGFNNTDNNININFFSEEISVRQSIAHLSFHSKCPITPLISYYSKDCEPNWMMLETIYPNDFKSAKDYARYAIQSLYTNLQEMIMGHYDEWQGWFHIHKSNTPQKQINVSKNDFNPDLLYKTNRYAGLFIILDSYFVINKLTYKIIRLTKELYNDLFSGNVIDKDIVGLNVLKQLYDNGIIVKC